LEVTTAEANKRVKREQDGGRGSAAESLKERERGREGREGREGEREKGRKRHDPYVILWDLSHLVGFSQVLVEKPLCLQ